MVHHSIRIGAGALIAGAMVVLPAIAFADDGPDYGREGDARQTMTATGAPEMAGERGPAPEQRDMEKPEATSSEMGGPSDEGLMHQSRIAAIVHELQSVASSSKAIGDDVAEVARNEASSSEDVARVMHDLDSESGVKKFFFGPDYKNLGQLRSSIVTTQNSISRLSDAKDRTTDSSAKAALETQISALMDEASSTQAFVDTHENVFSLLGWFVKLFAK